MSGFISFAAAVSGQSHEDDTLAQSPTVNHQKVSITSQKVTNLQNPPTLEPSKCEKLSPTPEGDHTCSASSYIVHNFLSYISLSLFLSVPHVLNNTTMLCSHHPIMYLILLLCSSYDLLVQAIH